MARRTPLYSKHVEAGGKMVDFAGWDMPIHYGSQMDEHHAVRKGAGMFDVSHMTVVDLHGPRTREFLRFLLANDVDRLKSPGRAMYTCMLNNNGGVIDDLIVYWRDGDDFRLVVNAGTRDKDLAWLNQHGSSYDVSVRERDDLAMIAVQGPGARELAARSLPVELKEAALAASPFSAVAHKDWFVARTGYTGEDGFEIIVSATQAAEFWQALADSGVKPCGLGARDTLRLEAGMNLYGQDMDEDFTPLDSGLGWTVAWEPADRDFIGRSALEKQKDAGVEYRFVGLVLDGRGVLRAHQPVIIGDTVAGTTTSGTYSPSMEKAIGLARVAVAASGACEVEIRGRRLAAHIVKPPFVRNGEVKVK